MSTPHSSAPQTDLLTPDGSPPDTLTVEVMEQEDEELISPDDERLGQSAGAQFNTEAPTTPTHASATKVREHSSAEELCGSHVAISPAMLRTSNTHARVRYQDGRASLAGHADTAQHGSCGARRRRLVGSC